MHKISGGFSRLYKLVENSGWVDYFLDDSVLSPAQLKGFKNGKAYEACMRCYLVLSEAIGRLILQEFLADEVDGIRNTEAWSTAMSELRGEGLVAGKITAEAELRALESTAVRTLFENFEAYMQRVSDGADSACSGKNGAFLSVVLDAVWRVIALDLSVRDDNFDCFM